MRVTDAEVSWLALSSSSSSTLLCRRRHGGRLGVVQVLAGGSEVGFRAVTGPSGRYIAEERGSVLLPWLERATGLVLIRVKAFADDVGGDGGGALWASFFPAVGTIAWHQAIVALGA
jgi:hypothetical protein